MKSKSGSEVELIARVDDTKNKLSQLMEENKELKKRIREVMQSETDYQDTIAMFKV